MDQRTDTSPSPAATLIDWVASVKLVTESEPVLILVWRGGSSRMTPRSRWGLGRTL